MRLLVFSTLGGIMVTAAGAGFAQDAEPSAGPKFKGYGWLNPAYLSFDDGQETKGVLVNNNNSIGRIGLWVDWTLDAASTLKFNIESNLGTRASNTVTMTTTPDAFDWSTQDIRKLELIYGSGFGVLSAGQGNMATDHVAEIDFSGTKLSGYSYYDALAGGFAFRNSDGTLSDVSVKKVFTNLELFRLWRLRYDTPEMSGFTASVAYGTDILSQSETDSYYDAALRYAGTAGDFQIGAGLGYNVTQPESGPSTENLTGSVAVLHTHTGLNGTIAAGSVMDGGSYYYLKAGWIGDLVAAGQTAFAVEYYESTDIGVTDGSGTSRGIMVNQALPHQIDAYAGYREYDLSQTGASYMTASSYVIGVKWVF